MTAKTPAVKATTKRHQSKTTQSPGDDVGSKSADAIVLATPDLAQNSESPETPKRLKKWEAEDINWKQLSDSRFFNAWRIAALALGLKPLSDIDDRLIAAGKTDKKREYTRLLNVMANNLTGEDDINRLRYATGADADFRAKNPDADFNDRVLDVVEFVRFAKLRNISIDEKMTATARQFTDPISSTNVSLESVPESPVKKQRRGDSPEIITVGLLILYLKDLVEKNSAPPKNIFHPEKKWIITSRLAQELIPFANKRTGKKTLYSLNSSGTSVSSLSRVFDHAAELFADDIAASNAQVNSDTTPTV
jgi:hypothetical protein